MWVRVEDEEMISKMMRALSKPDLREFLISCIKEPKAVSTLATELDLPLSTTYDHVHELVEVGLLAVERVVITDEGKRHEMYRSVVEEVRTAIRSDRLVVELLPNENAADRFYRLWSSLKKAK